MTTNERVTSTQTDGQINGTYKLWLTVVTLCMATGFHFGYHLVLTNPAEAAFLNFLNESMSQSCASNCGELTKEFLENRWSLYVSIMFFGAVVGSFFIQMLADSFGRKFAVLLTVILQIVGCSIAVTSYFANSHYMLAASRFILGFAQAIAVGVAPMYISEISPASSRGIISLSTALFMQISIVVASILAMPQVFGQPGKWPHLYYLELAILTPAAVILFFLPESPVYLTMRGRRTDAVRSLEFYQKMNQRTLVSEEERMKEELANARETLSIFSVWKDAETRPRVFTACVVMFSMIASGIVVINGFAVSMFVRVGLDLKTAAWYNVGICVIMVGGCFLSSYFIDRFGRRPLLLFTLPALVIFNILIAIFIYFESMSSIFAYLMIAVICIFALVFSTGPCPVSFFLAAELCPPHSRGAAMTWTSFVLATIRTIVLAIYSPLLNLIGSALTYFILFVPVMVAAIVYLYFFLPETKKQDVPISKDEMEPLQSDSSKSV